MTTVHHPYAHELKKVLDELTRLSTGRHANEIRYFLYLSKNIIMRYPSRKEFLQLSAATMAGILLKKYPALKDEKLKLAFSTLGCPDWTFSQITGFAKSHGYTGIEVRGIRKQMDLTLCNEFNTDANRAATRKLMKDNGLQFINLGSSANLHLTGENESKKSMDEAMRFIDLAGLINCPFVRVFPNRLPKDQKDATIKLIAERFRQLGEYAMNKKVKVLMETHGDAVWADDLVKIMELTDHKNTGLVWDICNMWTITKEPPSGVFPKLKKYIDHTHIKDAKLEDNKLRYVLLGKGDVPIFDAIDILVKNNYKGYYSFEWEKMWHPEIEEPEIALADYPVAIKNRNKTQSM